MLHGRGRQVPAGNLGGRLDATVSQASRKLSPLAGPGGSAAPLASAVRPLPARRWVSAGVGARRFGVLRMDAVYDGGGERGRDRDGDQQCHGADQRGEDEKSWRGESSGLACRIAITAEAWVTPISASTPSAPIIRPAKTPPCSESELRSVARYVASSVSLQGAHRPDTTPAARGGKSDDWPAPNRRARPRTARRNPASMLDIQPRPFGSRPVRSVRPRLPRSRGKA